MKSLIFQLPSLGVILSATAIVLIGLFLLSWAKRRSRKKSGILTEILRDIGIGFIVAAVVTVLYEANTRSVKEHSDMVTVLNAIMESGITRDVWGEVQSGIIARHQLRRGAKVDLQLLREVTLPDGRKITMPPHQLVMKMTYEYDLYALTGALSKARIWHALDWQMHDSATDLPTFLSIKVSRDGHVFQTLDYSAIKKTQGVFDPNHGTMSLEGDLGVDLPPPDDKSGIHVISDRYEVVNFPGAYTLYMPEILAPPFLQPGQKPDQRDPTIRVTFGTIPKDIEVKLETYLEEHKFSPSVQNGTIWEFKGIMLPGQAVSFTFAKKPQGT